jgi:hypothetical protein
MLKAVVEERYNDAGNYFLLIISFTDFDLSFGCHVINDSICQYTSDFVHWQARGDSYILIALISYRYQLVFFFSWMRILLSKGLNKIHYIS